MFLMWLHVHVTGNPVLLFYVCPGFFLWNVRGIFAVLVWHLQQLVVTKKFSGPKYNLPKSDQMFFRQHYTGFFPVQRCLGVFWVTLQSFYLCNVVPRVQKQHWLGVFMSDVIGSFSDNIAQGFYLCNVVPEHTNIFLQENNLSWLTLHKKITCAVLTQG